MQNTNKNPLIAISLATYKRHYLLNTLLRSLSRIHPIPGVRLELRVVDNDKYGSAKECVDRLEDFEHPFSKVRYAISEEQNIALARNTGLNLGPADAIVFIDDDEEVGSGWLADLWKTFQETQADAVFAPVHGRIKGGGPKWLSKGRFFDKEVPATGTRIGWKETRTSNTLVHGKWFYGKKPFRFDINLGRSGGSDTELFSRMEAAGARFVSCQEALVWEDVPPSRANFNWLVNRRYRNGLLYERIASRIPDEIHPVWRFLRRLGAGLLYSIKGLPKTVCGQPHETIKGLLVFPLALGGLVAWINPDSVNKHVAYHKIKTADNGGASGTQHLDVVSMPSSQRVAFLTNIVSPYRLPVFKKLAAIAGWDFKVFTNAKTEFDRQWDVAQDELPVKRTATWSWKRKVTGTKPVKFEQIITLHLPYGLFSNLKKFRPDCVISLELGFRTAIAAAYCAWKRIPLVIWAYQSKVSSTQGRWRLWWRRWLLGRAEYVVGMGSQAREVLIGWGVSGERIIDAPNAADHDTLDRCLNDPAILHESRIIHRRYAADRKLAIVVGRLVPLKGIEYLIESWNRLPASTREKWNLVFVGGGPLESFIRQADPSVKIAGVVKPEQMATWYSAADLHIFPSCGDVWGLVVNEASICGTPSLCSIHAGCYDDLIADGKNGLGIDFTNTEEAVGCLNAALNREDLKQLGKEASKTVSHFTLSRLAAGFSKAVHLSLQKRPSREKRLTLSLP